MRKLVAGLVFIAVLAGTSGIQSFAQGGATGAISGVVVDSSGAVVAGAEVRIVNQQTGGLARALTSDASGAFTAQLMPVGVYTIHVKGSGFAESVFSDLDVRVTETTRITAKLSLQAQRQQIEVQAEVQQVETTTATTGQAIESQTIRNLPLATQNFQQLLTLSAGAQQTNLNSSTQLGRGDVRIDVNGQREDNNNYLIEGISATDYNVAELTTTPLPNPDVVEEFKVQTSLYDATQGRNGGGNINAILKSGTRSFHGDVYEFFRNTSLDANDYFLKQSQLEGGESNTRPVIQQNIFGGSLGGPIGPGAKLGFFLRIIREPGSAAAIPQELSSARRFRLFRPVSAVFRQRNWQRFSVSRASIRLPMPCYRPRAISLELPPADICTRLCRELRWQRDRSL